MASVCDDLISFGKKQNALRLLFVIELRKEGKDVALQREKKYWPVWVSNHGPPGRGATVLPLSYTDKCLLVSVFTIYTQHCNKQCLHENITNWRETAFFTIVLSNVQEWDYGTMRVWLHLMCAVCKGPWFAPRHLNSYSKVVPLIYATVALRVRWERNSLFRHSVPKLVTHALFYNGLLR